MRETESRLISFELDDFDRAAYFKFKGYRIIDEKREGDTEPIVEAVVMIENCDGKVEHTADSGNGPVNALDNAIRKALSRFYPVILNVNLLGYSVRAIQLSAEKTGTASGVEVNIISTDGKLKWRTTGESEDVIEASCSALVDSYRYKLIKEKPV